jgi:hypothetical protein
VQCTQHSSVLETSMVGVYVGVLHQGNERKRELCMGNEKRKVSVHGTLKGT